MAGQATRVASSLLVAILVAGCDEENFVDDSLPSNAEARAIIERFQAATAEGDDEKACALMDEQMRESGLAVAPGSPAGNCSIAAALPYEGEIESLPEAAIVYARTNKHDDLAQAQLDNGTRFFLRRAGTNADGEWRIRATGYRPSPEDW